MGSIAENKGENPRQRHITFYVNGKIQIVKDEYPLETSLNTYLRDVLKLTGTKVLCNEGGCGCCAINARVLDKTTNTYVDKSVNSCLLPLYSSDGYSFTTVEGIGNIKDGLHPIQKRLADRNGSQCGYCSPGFIMNMYSLLKNNSKPTKEEIEKSLDGNICRCTGYRAILDSMKSFSVDDQPIDIEDISNLKCLKNNNSCGGSCHSHDSEPNHSKYFTQNNQEWYSPSSIEELNQLLLTKTNQSTRIIAGNTSIGIYKDEIVADRYIHIENINEFYKFEKKDKSIEIGSAVSLTKLRDLFKEQSKADPINFGHLDSLASNIERIGNVHVRNNASWAGNLALKKNHPDFPSDVLMILETAGASLNILRTNKQKSIENLSIYGYLNDESLRSGTYLTLSMVLPVLDQEKTKLKVFKVSPRSQNSHSYINSGFRFSFLDKSNTVLDGKPSIIFNGISEGFFHAKNTEEYLAGKNVTDQGVYAEAKKTLEQEIRSSGINEINDALLPSTDYRINLALSMFYKFFLSLNVNVKEELKSAVENVIDLRSVSTAEQSFEQKKELFPLTQPIPKLNAYNQVSGESIYIDDLSPLSHQLASAFILSTVGRANIGSIEYEHVKSMPGVVAVYFAEHIPGINSVMPPPFGIEPLFADKEILYAGQPIGLVVAHTHDQAKSAAKAVKVNYVDVKKPILTIRDAIEQKSFHAKPSCGDLVIGDAENVIKKSKNTISGELDFQASQFNFYIEGVIGVCEPTEDGYKIQCTTQWMDIVQRTVADVLGIKNSSCIDLELKQLGGAFGGKTTRGNIVAAATALAAHHLRKPVKMSLYLNDCMDMIGKRPPWLVRYNVGFDDNGKLEAMVADWYSDPGFTSNGSNMPACFRFFDNAYYCPNYYIKTHFAKTNKPASTEVRSPDVFPSIHLIEPIMEHVAKHLNKDPLLIREINLYNNTHITPTGHKLPYIDLPLVINRLKESCNYYMRKEDVDAFNAVNRYKKRGISLIPLRYSLTYNLGYYNSLLSIRHHDGSVAISHGGVEMGQGIHTKIAQVCAFELGIPIQKISVKSTNNLVNPNVIWSGGSVTTELVSATVIECCRIIKERLEPFRKLMPENYTWEELIAKAFSMNADLSAMYLYRPPEKIEDFDTYDIDAASCSEVLIDVLTGETQVLRTDIVYDCGQTMNGLIDIGQVEGGFCMGLGVMLLEKTVYDPETGRCLNNGTWEYKPPTAEDIPVDFRITFLQNKPNPVGVLGSKATAEPTLFLSCSIYTALRNAIESARRDRGVEGYFKFDLPATIDNVQQACLVNTDELVI